MKYIDYIKLGFKRIDTSDSVEFDQTGYYGFILSKKLSKNVSIELCAGELATPMLYIKKNRDGDCIVLPISIEEVKTLCKKLKNQLQ